MQQTAQTVQTSTSSSGSRSQPSSRRIRREQKTVRAMLALFCRDQHADAARDPKADLCPSCQALFDYSQARVENCRFGVDKPTCVNCVVHCFKPAKREAIREVMRYAGPRMPLKHPLLTVFHLLDNKKPAPELRRRSKQQNRVDPPRA